MAGFDVRRAGAILAVSDFGRSLAFYRDLLGFALDALYDDPPYSPPWGGHRFFVRDPDGLLFEVEQL